MTKEKGNCPKCGKEMKADPPWGYICDPCEMYFTHAVLDAGVFDKDKCNYRESLGCIAECEGDKCTQLCMACGEPLKLTAVPHPLYDGCKLKVVCETCKIGCEVMYECGKNS